MRMHLWEDFAFGTKPTDTIARRPEGTASIAASKPRETLVRTNSQTVQCAYRGDHAEVTRVFEMLSPFFEISLFECFKKRTRIKSSNDKKR